MNVFVSAIIGLGSANDPDALKLETRAKTWIKNCVLPETPPALMVIRIQTQLQAYPKARNISASSIYNCFGQVFAARRCAIVDDEDVEAILRDDGYRRLPWNPATWMPGDVVIYRKESGTIEHAGHICRITSDLSSGNFEVIVRSTWGIDGEYDHPIADVPPLLGKPTEVLAQRFLAP